MDISTVGPEHSDTLAPPLSVGQKSLLAVLCVVAGVLALSMRYVPGEVLRIVWGLVVAALFLAVALSLRWGSFGRALIIGIAGFAFFYGLFVIHPASQFFPAHGAMTTSRVLALTPALLTVVLGNGFLEELVFRGLFLRKYNAVFGPYL